MTEVDEEKIEEEVKTELSENEDNDLDLLTVDCKDMPKMIETLIRKENKVSEGIEKIKDLKKMFPDRKELNVIYDDAKYTKKQIHNAISNITTHFSMCSQKNEETTTPKNDIEKKEIETEKKPESEPSSKD